MTRGRWFNAQLTLISELMDLLDPDKATLMLLDRANPVIFEQIARYDRILFEAVPGVRVSLQVAGLRRYAGTTPPGRVQNRSLFKHVENTDPSPQAADVVIEVRVIYERLHMLDECIRRLGQHGDRDVRCVPLG